ncbi:hypothetical protein P9074_08725 [Gallibacterium anatis]|uniref:hypothetical protein n=3 Tax=Gallibacterium anatis TaxID=750 RepID=UPI0005316002|nr:hypothetical protein [Gallibacterium anatis]KGQ64552.1 hypothetical protein IO47_11570 [Gallibacterium anatis]
MSYQMTARIIELHSNNVTHGGDMLIINDVDDIFCIHLNDEEYKIAINAHIHCKKIEIKGTGVTFKRRAPCLENLEYIKICE